MEQSGLRSRIWTHQTKDIPKHVFLSFDNNASVHGRKTREKVKARRIKSTSINLPRDDFHIKDGVLFLSYDFIICVAAIFVALLIDVAISPSETSATYDFLYKLTHGKFCNRETFLYLGLLPFSAVLIFALRISCPSFAMLQFSKPYFRNTGR